MNKHNIGTGEYRLVNGNKGIHSFKILSLSHQSLTHVEFAATTNKKICSKCQVGTKYEYKLSVKFWSKAL